MRGSTKLLLVASALCAAPLAAMAQGYMPLGVDGFESEDARLERSSFQPIGEVAAAKRVVRRVTYRDPFASPYAPAVALEKSASGEITFTVTAAGGKVKETGVVTPTEWAELTAMGSALAPPKPMSARAKTEVCHAKLLVIETAEGGKAKRRNASMCGGEGDYKAMAYAYKVAEIAVSKIAKCEKFISDTREPSWTLAECIKPPRRRGADQGQ